MLFVSTVELLIKLQVKNTFEAWGKKNQIEVSILAGNKLGDKTSRRYTRQVRTLIDRFKRKQ